ncbi:MAG: queuosine precursor transporter [Pseudomonadota bacterium]
MRSYRYYDFIVAGMVTVLLCSNLIGPAKVAVLDLPFLGPFNFGAGNIFFPLGYIFGDILTEVYGYSRARRAIWSGFAALIFASFMSWAMITLPASPTEPFNAALQPALETAFGSTLRIVLAALVAYWLGDFVNSYVMAKLKVLTQGRYLWSRTIGSTICGQAVDSIVFYPIAFYGIWTNDTMLMVVFANFAFKVTIEVLFTPVTYAVVNYLKRKEGVDTYDVDTNFSPFSLRGDEGVQKQFHR